MPALVSYSTLVSLGKTSIALALVKLLRDAGSPHRSLVIAPLRVCHSVWPEEAAKWADFADLRVTVLHGPYLTKDRAIEEDADVYVINPEGLFWLATKLRTWDVPSVLFVDESTKFKHPRTQRYRLLRDMLKHFDRRYILTGTPAPNGLMDLFGQIFLIDGGASLGKFITHYRNNYFYQAGYGGYTWVPKADSSERIQKAIAPVTMRLDAADYLDLPKRIVTDIPVELPPAARKTYQRLEKDFVVQLKSGDVTAYNAGALSSKLRQTSNGFLYLDGEERQTEQVHTAKVDALVDLVEGLQGQPLVVAYEFTSERDYLCNLFDAPYIGGGTPARKGRELVKQWNAGELPILIAHPQSAGHGLNLQDGGHHICFFGLTWNLEYYEQFIRRLDRQGQTKPVHVYRLYCPNTVDRTVMRALSMKHRVQANLLDALKEDML